MFKKTPEEREQKNEARRAAGKPVTVRLGHTHGTFYDYGNGDVAYQAYRKLTSAFRINVADVTGFAVRGATKEDRKELGAERLQQVVTIQGGGTQLAAVAVNYGTAEKIETWMRAHPLFGTRVVGGATVIQAATPSALDQIKQLAELRDAGVLTEDEFQAKKASLLDQV